jgi:hypothetical protein
MNRQISEQLIEAVDALLKQETETARVLDQLESARRQVERSRVALLESVRELVAESSSCDAAPVRH